MLAKEVFKILINSNFEINKNALEEFCRLLIPEAKDMEFSFISKENNNEIKIELKVLDKNLEYVYKNLEERIYDFKFLMVKHLLLKFFDKDYKWGTLIGVRPTKLVRRLLNLGFSFDEIELLFRELYLLSGEKIELLFQIVKKEMKYLNVDKINVYIGIPFCPTKCKYCSFASYEIHGKQGQSYDSFVETLLEEIELSGQFLKEKGFEIESLYMGGGTPTTLNERDLEKVLSKTRECFDLKNIKEFTVEAGRIDTLNEEKLMIMKKFGVDRISINPQTFNEEVLRDLNRYFDKKQFDEIYQKARTMDFIINMDLIVGLPKETTEDILMTLSKIEEYEIENLTIHILALKKASHLYKEGHVHEELDYEKISSKINAITEKKGLKPYYMYRQKNTLEWGENIGYAIEGKESIFNIQMIEESQSTFGLGGGAITKYTNGAFDEEIELERIVNPKEPMAYIKEMRDRFEKKKKIFTKEN